MLHQPRPVVIVTRPVEQAQSVVECLSEWGYAPLLLPALTISALPWSQQTRENLLALRSFDFIHFSSPNAIDYALASDEICHLGCAPHAHIGLMGPGSRAALRCWWPQTESRWISPAVDSGLDSEALIKNLAQQPWMAEVRRALLIKGQGGRRVLADWLSERSIEVAYAEVYGRTGVEYTDEVQKTLAQAAAASRCVWLLSSSEGVLALGRLLQQASEQIQRALWAAPALTNHQRVAQAARQAGFRHVYQSESGEHALKAALESLYD